MLPKKCKITNYDMIFRIWTIFNIRQNTCYKKNVKCKKEKKNVIKS